MSFAPFGLHTLILKGIRASGFTEPTAIQSRAIPVILQGNDLIGVAQSGSGKTGAYCIPILTRLIESAGRLTALVVAPTRELASYVETRARDYARYTDLRIDVVFTGAPISPQERALRERAPDLLVATPGRLLELHARGCLNFEDIEILVLEEADRMVALGLGPDLKKLLKLLPETRQTLMFTVTMPPELNRLAKEALIEPVRVDMAPPAKPSAGITQAIYPVPRDLKPDLLDEMLSRAEVRSTILFCRTRTSAERVAKQLQRRGYTVAILDEHPSQGEREQALEDLLRGRVQILVASDASGRSLDVTGTSHVLNFDVPPTAEDYVHRLGRANRAEAVGDVFTLMSPEEQDGVAAIERLMGRAIPRVMLPDFDYGMHPGEIKRVVSYDDRSGPAAALRGEGGLQGAASRISLVPRAGRAALVVPGRNSSKSAAGAAKASSGSKKPAARPKSKSRSKPKPGARATSRTKAKSRARHAARSRPARARGAKRSGARARTAAKRRPARKKAAKHR